MPSRRRTAESIPVEGRDRWRRRVLTLQGSYYLLTGIWPLVHFGSFADAVALVINPFQAQVFGAVIAVVGGSLIEAGRRGPPGRLQPQPGNGAAAVPDRPPGRRLPPLVGSAATGQGDGARDLYQIRDHGRAR